MAGLMLLGALVCFVLAVIWPLGTIGVLLVLLGALGLLLAGTARVLRERGESRPGAQARLLDAADVQRLREALEARRQASEQ